MMTNPTLKIHRVTKVTTSKINEHGGQHKFFTKGIVIETKDGQKIEVTMFSDFENNLR